MTAIATYINARNQVIAEKAIRSLDQIHQKAPVGATRVIIDMKLTSSGGSSEAD